MLLVELVGPSHDLTVHAVGIVVTAGLDGVVLRRQQSIFSVGNGTENAPRVKLLWVNVEFRTDLLHQRPLFARVGNRKGPVITELFNVAPQNPDTQGVEG